MFKIGDFSKLSQVTVKALRYYDEIGLLRPAHVDQFTNYRYYSADQLPRLNRILALKDLGFSLDDIVCLLDEDLSPAEMRGMLRMRQIEIQHHLAEERDRLERVEARLRQIEQEDGKMSEYEVVLKQVEPLKVAAIRRVIPSYSDVGGLFVELSGYLGQNRIEPTGPPLAVYHDHGYREEQVDVETAVPVEKAIPSAESVKVHNLPGGRMVSTIHQGSYNTMVEAYNALLRWMEANGYQISGPSRQVYLQGPQSDIDPSSFVTEIQFPVEKA